MFCLLCNYDISHPNDRSAFFFDNYCCIVVLLVFRCWANWRMRILIVYDSNITDCDCPVRKQLESFFGDARSGEGMIAYSMVLPSPERGRGSDR